MPGDARGSVCVAAICRYTLSFAQLFWNMVQQPAVAAVNGGMIRHRCTKTAQQHVAGLRLCQCDTVKTSRLHIVKIEILTVTPPVIPAMKIRHLNSRQMVSIPEQRVTVRHPVLKAPPGEMRHTAELVNRPRQTSHHGKSLCTCSRRSASLSRGRPPG